MLFLILLYELYIFVDIMKHMKIVIYIYICEVYVQYIFQTCIFFHYLFSDKQALPNTINNYCV